MAAVELGGILWDSPAEDAADLLIPDFQISDPATFGKMSKSQISKWIENYMNVSRAFGLGVELSPPVGKPSFSAWCNALARSMSSSVELSKRFLAGIIRARSAGKLPAAIYNPLPVEQAEAKEKAENPSILDTVTKSVKTVVRGAAEGAESTANIISWLPWIYTGAAVAVVSFVAWPYLQAARAPAKVAQRVTR